ncbi:hypothetical protein D322_2382 [Yersinia enterocolitica IP 10393]|nr:hypothetical protein D322_2382 [Yersinia enterocolitica IP 10393]
MFNNFLIYLNYFSLLRIIETVLKKNDISSIIDCLFRYHLL